jgi:DNA-binding NarL/FixJ family response regulator
VASLPSVRLGLADMLSSHGHTVLGEDDGADGAAVWVLDAPGAPALDAVTAQRYSDAPRAAVVLSDEPGMANLLARAGLRGWACLARDADADQLDLAVRSAEAGLVLLDLPVAATSLMAAATVAAPAQAMEPLTARELQVLQLVAQGLPNKGIARRLGISENTAKFHVASLCGKLGASSRTEAVTLAARRGLILL